MDIVDLAPDLRMLRFPTGQAYALRDGRDITLIDTGPPGSADAIAAALDGWGRVRRVVLTHYHADHAGSAREVAAWPGVQLAAHHADARVVRGEAKGEWPTFTPAEQQLHAVVAAGLPDPPDVAQARIDLDLDDGDVLDGLQVIWTPGHTPGSIALRHEERAGSSSPATPRPNTRARCSSAPSTSTGGGRRSRSGGWPRPAPRSCASATAPRCWATGSACWPPRRTRPRCPTRSADPAVRRAGG